MDTKTNNYANNPVLFRIIDSRTGNITRPSLAKNGSKVNFDYALNDTTVEITVGSTTFCSGFFYRLTTRSSYSCNFELKAILASAYGNDVLSDITLMSQDSLKRHSNIFKQFNAVGLFQRCSIEEKTFEDLSHITGDALKEMALMEDAIFQGSFSMTT
jgi:hypothetical protein